MVVRYVTTTTENQISYGFLGRVVDTTQETSPLMEFLDSGGALVDASVDGRSDGQCAANDGADTGEEACECFRPFFAVDDFHRGNVVAEEDAGDAAPDLSFSIRLCSRMIGQISHLAWSLSLCPS